MRIRHAVIAVWVKLPREVKLVLEWTGLPSAKLFSSKGPLVFMCTSSSTYWESGTESHRTKSHRTKSPRTKSHRTESHRTKSHNLKNGQNPTIWKLEKNKLNKIFHKNVNIIVLNLWTWLSVFQSLSLIHSSLFGICSVGSNLIIFSFCAVQVRLGPYSACLLLGIQQMLCRCRSGTPRLSCGQRRDPDRAWASEFADWRTGVWFAS